NWSSGKKWAAVCTVSSFTFISPVSSSLVAPAIETIAADFGVTNLVVAELMMSIFVLAYAIGPLFLGPLSELYGRVIVLQLANLWFLAFNIGCGFAQNVGQMIAFRFLAGLGGSAPLAIGGGVLSDCFKAEERGKSVAMYSLAPLLGPAIGPIAGSWVTQQTSWRWGFHAVSIADVVIQIGGLFLLRETYAPKILKWKAQRVRKETGDNDYYTEAEKLQQDIWTMLRTSIVRPFILIATQPIVQVLALYMAYIYGLMYLMLSSFPRLWTSSEYYGMSIGIGGLNYISLGLGFFVASQVGSRLTDLVYRRLKARSPDNTGKPEFRLPLLFGSAVLIPIGLFIYGWTAQYRTHWIGPNVGAFLVAAGVIPGFQGTQTYIIDAYTRYAASGVAAMAFLRSLAGFGFPLFSPYMYDALHYGWGNSLLGFVALGLGCPAPFLLWMYG
ncbi:RING-box protein 1, partial [Ascosphaera pollenicola]